MIPTSRRTPSYNRIVVRLVAGAMLVRANMVSAQVVQQGQPATDSVTLKQAVAHMEVSKFVGAWLGRSGKLLARFVAPLVMTPEGKSPDRSYRATGAFDLSFFLTSREVQETP